MGSPQDDGTSTPRSASLRFAEGAVARAVAAGALWSAGATLVAAVSGGADSLCLLGALVALQASGDALAPGEVVVATLDHGLRGEAGAADALWVADLAARLGLRCVSERVETRAYARANHLSLEDAARRLRYAFLRRVASETGAERICLGHTVDDQAETIILRLLRGSGLDGLAGMRPLRGDLARPLLGMTHAQAVTYCAARGWLPREDLTNRDERHLRNRVRRRLFPLLEAYNPGIRDALARNAAFIADDLAALAALTDDAWAQAFVGEGAGSVTLALSTMREQLPALRRRLLRRAAQQVSAPETPDATSGGLEARHIALIERFIASGRTGAALELPGGLRVALGYDALVLSRERAPQPPPQEAVSPGEWTLPVPGSVDADTLGWRVHAALLTAPPGFERAELPPAPQAPPLIHAGGLAASQRAELRVYLDADRVAGERLTVRAWRPGDRFRPLGMAHEKKLQDVFSDAKTPRAARRRLPIICAGERIVWVAGVRIADDVKLTPATRRTLALQAEPLPTDSIEESK